MLIIHFFILLGYACLHIADVFRQEHVAAVRRFFFSLSNIFLLRCVHRIIVYHILALFTSDTTPSMLSIARSRRHQLTPAIFFSFIIDGLSYMSPCRAAALRLFRRIEEHTIMNALRYASLVTPDYFRR